MHGTKFSIKFSRGWCKGLIAHSSVARVVVDYRQRRKCIRWDDRSSWPAWLRAPASVSLADWGEVQGDSWASWEARARAIGGEVEGQRSTQVRSVPAISRRLTSLFWRHMCKTRQEQIADGLAAGILPRKRAGLPPTAAEGDGADAQLRNAAGVVRDLFCQRGQPHPLVRGVTDRSVENGATSDRCRYEICGFSELSEAARRVAAEDPNHELYGFPPCEALEADLTLCPRVIPGGLGGVAMPQFAKQCFAWQKTYGKLVHGTSLP
eukprot:SAG11_NODE_223_length_12120_cov_6.351884_9_plen_265_part_00